MSDVSESIFNGHEKSSEKSQADLKVTEGYLDLSIRAVSIKLHVTDI